MESLLTGTMQLIEVQQKREMDLSYGKSNVSGESGVFSNGNDSESVATKDSSWECILKEVVDPDVFDPPVLNSSGIKDMRIPCSLSTIEGILASSSIGNLHNDNLSCKR